MNVTQCEYCREYCDRVLNICYGILLKLSPSCSFAVFASCFILVILCCLLYLYVFPCLAFIPEFYQFFTTFIFLFSLLFNLVKW